MSTDSRATLVSSDGVEVQATLQAVQQSVTLATMLELLDEEKTTGLPIPVPGVDGKTLAKVFEWCEHHQSDQKGEPEIPMSAWDCEFFEVEKNMLLEIANASNYLEIPLLLHFTVKIIAERLEGMNTEQMRDFLNIENDFSPDEESKIRDENRWVLNETQL